MSCFDDLSARSGASCELCSGRLELAVFPVPPKTEEAVEAAALLCPSCIARLSSGDPLNPNDWHCLQESAWSDLAPIQVLAWRILTQLEAESWASDLKEQLFLEADVLAWAEAGLSDAASDEPAVLDSNGVRLEAGDTVTIIKDLDVKGASFVAKRGTTVKNIRITSDPTHVEGRVNGTSIMLKTCFLKKITL